MGFKKWLGGDKPVTQYEFNLIHIGYVVMLAIFIFVYSYLESKDREQADRIYKAQIKREDQTFKAQMEWKKKVMDSIRELKLKDYCRHELGFKK